MTVRLVGRGGMGHRLAAAVVAALLPALLGCRPTSGVVPKPALSGGLATTSAPSPSASAPEGHTDPVAKPQASLAASGAAPTEFSAEQLRVLAEQLQSRRVFRHLTLGSMPPRERHSWLLSEDGRMLTIVCEATDSDLAESGPPDPKRWYVVASASFVAKDVPPGQSWGSRYDREQLIEAVEPSRTTCAAVGERIDVRCGPGSLQVFGPHAYVPVERPPDAPRADEGPPPIRWKPSTRRRRTGLSCTAAAGPPDDDSFPFYDFASKPGQPMLFFAERGTPIERVVHSSGGMQYADFRDGVVTPLDPRLPPHLIHPAP